MLTGTTPFDGDTLRKAAFDEMRRIIREEEPPRPSMRLSSLGATLSTTSVKRGSDPRRLDRSVRGELDWIAMKALEKDRRRRYETANDFAADVLRYLTDEPVEACPPSAWYRFGKLARRHRVALTTAALVGLALAAGTAASAWQAVRATRAGTLAGRKESRGAGLRLRIEGRPRVLHPRRARGGRPEQAMGRDLKVSEALANAEKKRRRRVRRPAPRGSRRARGARPRRIGHWAVRPRPAPRDPGPRRAPAAPGPGAPRHAPLDLHDGRPTLRHGGKWDEARALFEQVLEGQRRTLGPEDPDTLETVESLAISLMILGKPTTPASSTTRCWRPGDRVLGPEHPQTLGAMQSLAMTLYRMDKVDEAKALLEQRRRPSAASWGRSTRRR